MINYIRIARPDHWFKNVFMLPGTILAIVMLPGRHEFPFFFHLLLGLLSTCLIASANYVINEYLDAEFDKFHPVKKERPSVVGLVNPIYIILEYCILTIIGLSMAWVVGKLFLFFSVLLLIMGILYNVSPIRLKDFIYIDVLSESLNNPIQYFTGVLVRRRISHGREALRRV
jgi:decaprenyl-phosphate phosphoribosyltransferase